MQASIFGGVHATDGIMRYMKTITLEVLTAPHCVHCREFLEFWKTIAREWPNVTQREIEILTPEGQALSLTHHVFAAPGIIMNDTLLSSGGFNKEKFIEKLEALSL